VKGKLWFLLLCLIVVGCAEQRLYVSYYADKVLHPGNPKVLTFYGNPNTGQLTGSSWGRLCEVSDCANTGPAMGSGIVVHYPSACYARWWKECNHKNCRSGWWDRCLKKETK
jgi:hypothetical protein